MANFLRARTGKVTVRMNGATDVPASVFSAMKGRNVTAAFVLKNGIRWTVNGMDITAANDLSLASAASRNIPNSTVKTVSAGSVARTQVTIGDEADDFGLEAQVTVKLSAKRAGRQVYVYLYDEFEDTLDQVAITRITSSGYCSFPVTAAGDYLIVVE